MPTFDVNMGSIVKFSNKLEKLHKSAFPNAVRNTLNNAAFFTKKHTLQQEAQKQFINRDKNFFRAFSRVDKASGRSVKSMRSVVGMTDGSQSSINLIKQEFGGTISGRDRIPLAAARTSKDNARKVSRRSKLQNINIVDARKSKARTKKAKFMKAAIIAATKFGKTGHVQTTTGIFRINSIKTNIASRNTKIRSTEVYDFKKGRSVRIKKRPFLEPAAFRTQKIMPRIYEKEFKKQVVRFGW